MDVSEGTLSRSMDQALLQRLADYVRTSTSLPANEGSPEAWRLDGLDSLEMLQLLTWLEGQFAIQVREQDVRPEHFGTVGDLARYVARRRG
ncbi:MAG TPA: acyl carrier protein [Candidatus Polarisedimenticolaceae bacterium]|nr:acyl carrier protein [Candidatus Polarisedimenticolaceae bacterium]